MLAVGSGDRFCGIYHRATRNVTLYQRSNAGNRKGATKKEYSIDDPELKTLIEPDLWDQLLEDVELLEVRARGFRA